MLLYHILSNMMHCNLYRRLSTDGHFTIFSRQYEKICGSAVRFQHSLCVINKCNNKTKTLFKTSNILRKVYDLRKSNENYDSVFKNAFLRKDIKAIKTL